MLPGDGLLLVRPRALGEEGERILRRLQAEHRVTVLEDPRDLVAVTRDEWAVVAGPGSMPCDAVFFDRLRRVRAVIAVGSGIDGIDRQAASDRGILIGDGAVDENARDMASATLMLILALLHDLDGARARLYAGESRGVVPPAAHALGSRTIGLIGFGRIARRLVELLAPWRPEILVASPRLRADALPPNVRVSTLGEVLELADVVSIHAALNDETRGLIGVPELARMKPSAILVNTARGGIVDETAVAAALESRRLHAAAFDCFSEEPLAADSPLRRAPNVILTPHCIGHTVEGARAVAAMFEENIRRTLKGEPPCRLRNPEALRSTGTRRSTTS